MKEIDKKGEFTGDGFKFDVYPTKEENQKRYEELGEVMDREVYKLLETRGKLEKIEVRSKDTIDYYLII